MTHLAKYWNGKSIFITGASSGLGWALALELAKYDVHLGLTARREEKLIALKKQILAKYPERKVWTHSLDVQQRADVESCVTQFCEAAGGLDCLWANSGVGEETSFRQWSWQEAEDMIDTNIKGAIYTVEAGLKQMVPKQKGTIVGLSSAAAMAGMPGTSIYCMTKAALSCYLEAVAAEHPALQVTTICPGFVDTPINQNNPKRFWLLTPELAAVMMMTAVAKRRARYIYPFKMKLVFHFVQLLPLRLLRYVMGKAVGVHRVR